MPSIRQNLERWQALIYFACIALAAVSGSVLAPVSGLAAAIEPALVGMLYVTFLQVPLSALRRAWAHTRFLAALLTTNFIAIPLLVWGLSRALPADELLRLGVLLVLLAPCIDYVVTFAHMGKANSGLLLAATPVLLLVQMLLLPIYLHVMLGAEAAGRIQPGPFLGALWWMIAVPLLLAWLTQKLCARWQRGAQLEAALGLMPVPATALVLSLVVLAVIPQLDAARDAAWRVLPVYVLFAITAPVLGWGTAKLWRLDAGAARAIAFSGSTRNSLVVLPVALAVPGALPLLPAVIVTQTLVELVSELLYIRVIARWR